MLPWERRLRDLSRFLLSCGETYFTPDLFRQNTNQFLQTSRTVTFIIQKNKANIADYDSWYAEHVLNPWAKDMVMTWAKDARNVIEKEGDLDMHSYLAVSVVFSHIPCEDVIVDTPRPFLLQADINKIAKFAKIKLPRGVLDAAVLQIERRWVANSLPEHELISALTYVYSSVYRVCYDLAAHLGHELDASIPHPTDLDPTSNDVAKTRFIKLGKPNVGRMKTTRVDYARDFQPPLGLVELNRELTAMPPPKSLHDIVRRTAKMAEFTFIHHGNHVQMLFLFDDNWKQIDYLTTAFADQADKFLFWRNAAKRASYLRAAAFVWVSETWVRQLSNNNDDLSVREMPIIGEQLHVIGGAVDGEAEVVEWNVTRATKSGIVALEEIPPVDKRDASTIFFMRPMFEAMQSVRPR
jgi:hypothetical protein